MRRASFVRSLSLWLLLPLSACQRNAEPESTLEQVAQTAQIKFVMRCESGYELNKRNFDSGRCVLPHDVVLSPDELRRVLPLADSCVKDRWEKTLQRGPITLGKAAAGIEQCDRERVERASQAMSEQQRRVLSEHVFPMPVHQGN